MISTRELRALGVVSMPAPKVKSTEDRFTDVKRFGVHLDHKGESLIVSTGLNDKGFMCAFTQPPVPLTHPQFGLIKAVMRQALDDRNARDYIGCQSTSSDLYEYE